MRAVLMDTASGARPAPLVMGEVDEPVAGPGEVLLEVAAAGVNRADLLQRRGLHPPPAGESAILGLEAAGRIVALGPGVADWRVGDRVMALLAGGGYAERVAVPGGQLMAVPSDMSLLEAAAIPEAFLTAWMALCPFGRTQPGETVLIHAGAGGVGTAAIQIAAQLGARVIATTRREEKRDVLERLGARAIVAPDGRFVERVRDLVGPDGIDVAVDLVGAALMPQTIASMATDGRIAVIGLVGGARAEIDLGQVLLRRLTIRSGGLRGISRSEKAALVADFATWGLPRLEDGRLRPVCDPRRYRLAQADEAHAALRANATVGKIVLAVNER